MKPAFAAKVTLITVCKWVSLQYTIDCFADISTPEACAVTQKLHLGQMSERSIRTPKDTNMIKLIFCCKFGVYSLSMNLFGWLWWYMWPRMANKMSEEFTTTSLNITCFGTSRSSRRRPTRNISKKYNVVCWMKYETTAKTLFERRRKLKQT